MPFSRISTLTIWSLVSSALSAAPAAEALPEESSSVIPLVAFGIAVIVTAVLVVTGLTRWGRKQDEISSMLYFCIDFLVNTKNKTERFRAAELLGKTKNPEALLVLVDVINDESAEDDIKKAARDALLEMSQRYRRFTQLIAGLLGASEADDHERTVELLKTNFEHEGRKHVQSAYVIGRELVRMKEYAEARDWLRVAEARDAKHPMYVEKIRHFKDLCNQRLFAEGDTAFNAGDYHLANERFALAAQGLSTKDNKRFAYYVRAASVYCKLEEYENASEALLQALHHQQETDTVLEMNKLVSSIKDDPRPKEDKQNLSDELERFVRQTMDGLSARNAQT